MSDTSIPAAAVVDGMNTMTIQELIGAAQIQFASDSAKLDAELLLAFCLGRNRSFLYAWPEKIVDAGIVAKFNALVQRRRLGEPIAYLIGEREFWSLKLQVNSSTLIPRPETEKLVEIALQFRCANALVLDLGTGTGAIALALAKERPQWQLFGVDRNPDAVSLAETNAQKNLINNVRFTQSDWFSNVGSDQRFDLIVSNPPYIDAADPHLDQGDVRFEPRSALVAADQGLADIAAITQAAPQHLQTSGWLLIEHGFTQGTAARHEFSINGFTDITTWCDDGGRDRVTGGKLPAPHRNEKMYGQTP